MKQFAKAHNTCHAIRCKMPKLRYHTIKANNCFTPQYANLPTQSNHPKEKLQAIHRISLLKPRSSIFILAGLLLFCLVTIVTDLWESQWQGSSFYLSESLLFSTFWLLFFPVILLGIRIARPAQSAWSFTVSTVASIAIHLLAYPAWVWLLSFCFYNHAFGYGQTMQYAVSKYAVTPICTYGLAYTTLFFLRKKSTGHQSSEQVQELEPDAPVSMVVTDSGNRTIALLLQEIFYFSANPPYVTVHHQQKKYLHTATLKSLETVLKDHHFVRIHKSTVVNMTHVKHYRSRLNGDYDLTLTDESVLRVSRNYAARFKTAFAQHHQLTAV